MTIRRSLLILTLIGAMLAAQDAIEYRFSFAGEKGAEGWQKTSMVKVSPGKEALAFDGAGWDSKLYRAIKLTKGSYLFSGCGRGTLQLILLKSFEDYKNPVLSIDLSHQEWRTDQRSIAVENGTFVLLIAFGAGTNTHGEVKWVKVESAPAVPEVSQLRKERPSPAVVRGFTTASISLSKVGCGISTNREKFSAMRDLGANVARIPFGPYQGYMARYQKNFWESMPIMLDVLESQVKLARDAGIKVVPVLGGNIIEGKIKLNSGEFWEHRDLETNFCRIWEMVVKRLAPYRESIWAYDLMNEPLTWNQRNPIVPPTWRTIAVAAIKTIRTVDKEAWVVYETGPGSFSRGFDGLTPLPDTRVIYGAHFYHPQEFTHQGLGSIEGTDLLEAMKKINVRYPGTAGGIHWDKKRIEGELETAVTFQKKYQVPIYFGEFSVIKWAPKEDAVQWLTDVIDIFEANGWSWCYHSFREWPGWSLEHDDSFWDQKGSVPEGVAYETERAKVVKAGLRKNSR